MLVLCPFPQGVAAGQRLKYEQYFDDWRAHGWDITVSSFMDRPLWDIVYQPGHVLAKALGVLRGHARRLRDMTRLQRYDLVYVFMWVTPFGSCVLERRTRAGAAKLVFDVEDNLFGESYPTSQKHPNRLLQLIKSAHKARYLAREADLAIVASPYLLADVRQANRHHRAVRISPSLDTARIFPLAERRSDQPKPVIGWTGTFSSRLYLDLLSNMFVRLAARVPFTLRVIGNFEFELPGVDVDVVQWSAQREAQDLRSLDIGIYPLIDDAWSRGKAGLKIIQYQAAGLPCVATEAPLSRDQIREGETGFLVTSDDEWIDRLEQLLRQPELRKTMGEAARKDAVERYSMEAVGGQYRQLLDEMVPPRAVV